MRVSEKKQQNLIFLFFFSLSAFSARAIFFRLDCQFRQFTISTLLSLFERNVVVDVEVFAGTLTEKQFSLSLNFSVNDLNNCKTGMSCTFIFFTLLDIQIFLLLIFKLVADFKVLPL